MSASEAGEHCPFLNRSDARCSKFFTLDQLEHAFEHCFGDYAACAVYGQLLDERVRRRRMAKEGTNGEEGNYIQVTVTRRYEKPIPHPARFSAVPGLRTGTGG